MLGPSSNIVILVASICNIFQHNFSMNMQLVLLSDLWSLDDPMEKVAKRTGKFRMRGASIMEK